MNDKELRQILNDSNTPMDMKIRALKKVRPDLIQELKKEVEVEFEISLESQRNAGLK